MNKLTLILAGAAALALAGCGGSQEAATENAQDNLAAVAENAADNMAAMASNVEDADQANALVNESMNLSNAGEAVENAEGNAAH